MIQKVNDVRVLVLVKVLEWPGREVVKQAIATGEWVNLVIATYDNCVETTGAITLTGVHGFCDEPSGTFAFSGRFETDFTSLFTSIPSRSQEEDPKQVLNSQLRRVKSSDRSVSSDNAFDSNIVDIAPPLRRLVIRDAIQPWSEKVQLRLQELMRLEHGWDGYYGIPVSFENAIFALHMLEAICGYQTPSPQIVPGTEGDLQIEWHTLKGDIELHVKRPNEVHAWCSWANSDHDEELDLTNDFLAVAKWIREVTESSIASQASAI